MANISPAEIQYQEEHRNQSRAGELLGASITMFVLSNAAVATRLLCKRRTKMRIAWEDYTVILALVSSHRPLQVLVRDC